MLKPCSYVTSACTPTSTLTTLNCVSGDTNVNSENRFESFSDACGLRICVNRPQHSGVVSDSFNN